MTSARQTCYVPQQCDNTPQLVDALCWLSCQQAAQLDVHVNCFCITPGSRCERLLPPAQSMQVRTRATPHGLQEKIRARNRK